MDNEPQAETQEASAYLETPAMASARRRWTRSDVAERLADLDRAVGAGESERSFAERSGTPRSTLRRWDQRRDDLGLEPSVAAFFESPAGAAFLHRLVTALVFVLCLRSPSGIRLICEFLELSGLAGVVAPSFSSVRRMAIRMEAETLTYGASQGRELAQRMAPKRITLAEDETYHPEICLVATEPVSNFIVVEEYAEHRDADAWNAATKKALDGLRVEVIQTTTDEAKGLLAHAAALGAHHSPDVFHVQHTVSRAISSPLARREERAVKALGAAAADTAQAMENWGTYDGADRGPGRPPDLAARLLAMEEAERVAELAAKAAGRDRVAAREATAWISAVYHPYRLSDGARQSPEAVGEALWTCIENLQEIVDRAGLPQRCTEGIEKAGRVIDDMVDTIRFEQEETSKRLSALQIPEELHREVASRLVPSLYLRRVAARASGAEVRAALEKTAADLLEPMLASEHPFALLDPARRAAIKAVAAECADLFQRSSSCVEGRNGQLSLHHHGTHRLDAKKLGALTVVHNYFITREDGTTAAERFFGWPPDDLFEHLVARMPQPSRPAAKRPSKRLPAVRLARSDSPERVAA
jgi:hypothetical protein